MTPLFSRELSARATGHDTAAPALPATARIGNQILTVPPAAPAVTATSCQSLLLRGRLDDARGHRARRRFPWPGRTRRPRSALRAAGARSPQDSPLPVPRPVAFGECLDPTGLRWG